MLCFLKKTKIIRKCAASIIGVVIVDVLLKLLNINNYFRNQIIKNRRCDMVVHETAIQQITVESNLLHVPLRSSIKYRSPYHNGSCKRPQNRKCEKIIKQDYQPNLLKKIVTGKRITIKYKITNVKIYGNFRYAIFTFSKSNLSSVALEPKHRKSKNSNIAKEALKSKQFEMGSKIRRQGKLLIKCITFEAFPYFQCFII